MLCPMCGLVFPLTACENQHIRGLRAGPVSSTGLLVVLHNGEWGTVCGRHQD